MSKGVFSSSFLLVWVLCAGCYTKPMWDDATCKALSRPVVCGSLPTSPRESRAPQWLIRYSTQPASREMFAIHILPDREFYFLLVTDGNGVPGSPFRYDSRERQWSRIDAAIPAEQRQVIEGERLAPIAREDAQKLMARRDFVSASAMRLVEMGHLSFGRGSGIWAYAGSASAGATASPLLPASGETNEQRWHATTNPTLSPDAIIVLLPTQQPRPSGNRRGAMAAATLLTPATAVVDVVTIVVVWVGLGVMAIANVF